jgi:hypothetical protein
MINLHLRNVQSYVKEPEKKAEEYLKHLRKQIENNRRTRKSIIPDFMNRDNL